MSTHTVSLQIDIQYSDSRMESNKHISENLFKMSDFTLQMDKKGKKNLKPINCKITKTNLLKHYLF